MRAGWALRMLPCAGGAQSLVEQSTHRQGDHMGFLDKAKAAAEQAATRAKEGVEEVQSKRNLAHAYEELGRTAFDLIEEGQISNDRMTGLADEIRKMRAAMPPDNAAAAQPAPAAAPPSEHVAAEPASPGAVDGAPPA